MTEMNRKRKRKKIAKVVQQSIKLKESKSAKASGYLHHPRKYHEQNPDIIAMLYNRESSHSQNDNHITNEKVLRRRCKKLGIPVASFYFETITGKILGKNRRALMQAVRKAKAKNNKGEHAIILASASDRFLRDKNFNPKTSSNILPSKAQFKRLRKLTRGVPLVTLLHPDMPPKKVRGHQSRWGQRVKGNNGGRPKINEPGYKKKIRIEKMSQVLRLRKNGASWGNINALTGVAKSTAADWLKKYD